MDEAWNARGDQKPLFQEPATLGMQFAMLAFKREVITAMIKVAFCEQEVLFDLNHIFADMEVSGKLEGEEHQCVYMVFEL